MFNAEASQFAERLRVAFPLATVTEMRRRVLPSQRSGADRSLGRGADPDPIQKVPVRIGRFSMCPRPRSTAHPPVFVFAVAVLAEDV